MLNHHQHELFQADRALFQTVNQEFLCNRNRIILRGVEGRVCLLQLLINLLLHAVFRLYHFLGGNVVYVNHGSE